MSIHSVPHLTISEETLPTIAALGEMLPGGFFLYHAFGDQELIGFNSKMVSLYGCENDEDFKALVHNSFKGIVHPEDYEATERSIRHQIETGDDRLDHVVYRYIRKDGSVGMMDDYGRFAHSDAAGDVYYVFVQDISQQYQERLQNEWLEEQRRRDLIQKLTGSESTYIVNPETDGYTVVGQNDYLQENYPAEETFTASITRYIEKDVDERDRAKAKAEMVSSRVAEKLSAEGDYAFRYRDISTGVPRWYEMRAARLSKTEILYGFSDVDDQAARQILYEKFKDNYFGLYYVNLHTGEAKILRTGHLDLTGPVGSKVPYPKLMRRIAGASQGEAAKFMNQVADVDYLKKSFATEDVSYYTYQSYLFEGERWISVTGRVLQRDTDGTPEIFAIGFSLMD